MSSLLPIVKEVVKILFARSLYCVLFATETFAADLNLPTRTAFARCRKRDAVRRGLDKTGTVFIMVSGEVTPENYLKDMMLGEHTKLESQFRLTYRILNLLLIEALKVEEMIKRSFSENSNQLMLP
ncbi:hypothetical protein B0I73DRAFT_163799 [Yarrowia lipolytica]|nr:hypothetical protein B0I73DRAFT_163799 [Yarrowia lipolytica]